MNSADQTPVEPVVPVQPVQDSPEAERWLLPAHVLGGYAIICGVITLLGASIYPPGWAILTRPLVAILGIIAGLATLSRCSWWKSLLILWVVVQVPLIVVDPSGELARQTGLWFGLSQGSMMASPDTIISAHSLGVNVGALLILLMIFFVLTNRWHFAKPAPPWLDHLMKSVALLYFILVAGIFGLLGLRYHAATSTPNAVLVIDAPLPGAEVYMEDKRIGTTPFAILPSQLIEWGLNQPGEPPKCQLRPTAANDGLALVGFHSAVKLTFAPPAYFKGQFQCYQTPWGLRAMPVLTEARSNHITLHLASTDQPGLILSEAARCPATCAPRDPLKLSVKMNCNPPDPRLKPSTRKLEGRLAKLWVFFWKQSDGTHYMREVEMPDKWTHWAPGYMKDHAFEVNAPEGKGNYLVEYRFGLLGGSNGVERLDRNMIRCLSSIEVK